MFLLSACASNKDMVSLKQIADKNEENIFKQKVVIENIINEHKKYTDETQKKREILLSKINNLKLAVDSLNFEIKNLKNNQITLFNRIKLLKKSKIADQKSKSETLYNKGMSFFRRKNYKKSLSIFREYVLKYPKNKLSPNAQYWIGECYYSQNRFEKAKDEFQNVLDFYPKSSKAPDAQVKIGIIYFKQNKQQQSLLELKRVLKMYPDYERREMVKSLIKEYR
jgi:tol-pal system protein YbgF